MAQLPASMRRKSRAAVTSIHEKPPTRAEKMANWGGWILLIIATTVFVAGAYGLYKIITDARVADLQVVGNDSALEAQQVGAYVKPIIRDNYFTSDLEKIRDRTLEISWVDRVVISRAWPNAIRVRVFPRHPIARWGTGRLLSENGDVYSEAAPQPHNDLPLLHGPISQSQLMMRRYNEINQLFQPFNLHLKELYLTERMTWFMQFDSGLRIIVDQDQTMSKLQRLSVLAGTDLKPIWSQIATVDLRYRNGLAIQWRGETPVSHGQFIASNNVASTPASEPNTAQAH
ncbi:cell division protein FtsQ/DivIB [Acinetobacter sp. ANC 3791]|uniref:cell division protein FtsQ/DivIB n=1 Tax=Acinetobacter sp. ANC 3791 TaxID=2529836 RepID=UPI00103D4B17|nr:cell division protein FtsQ/DivIB [Acinetobacter sp. ANC 3791]TCB85430.1 FtsQ-type POTRA domain-containing protein [Acinetobacter sp. ANC 3791]